MPPGILAPPELADRFRRLIQPVRIGQLRDKFDGAEKLYCIRPGLAQGAQLAGAHQQGGLGVTGSGWARRASPARCNRRRWAVSRLGVVWVMRSMVAGCPNRRRGQGASASRTAGTPNRGDTTRSVVRLPRRMTWAACRFRVDSGSSPGADENDSWWRCRDDRAAR